MSDVHPLVKDTVGTPAGAHNACIFSYATSVPRIHLSNVVERLMTRTFCDSLSSLSEKRLYVACSSTVALLVHAVGVS
jgi:hypothetical protein